MNIEHIVPSNYSYDLPESSIAKYPLSDRSASKLLFYNKGKIDHKIFSQLPDLIKKKSLIIFNNTKVIPARIIFWKTTGARIEVFLLEPHKPSVVMDEIMSSTNSCEWVCMIGNAKKWKTGTELSIKSNNGVIVVAKRVDENLVRFSWTSEDSFSEVLDTLGQIPLPPYIEREPDQTDKQRYQTVYSKYDGAVAAPTAGLHFTDEIISQLSVNHQIDFVTLHVSAGTFQPIKTNAKNHPMHREQILISRQNIENIIDNEEIIAIGTTSLRTLESVYWYGVKLISGDTDFFIPKLYPYNHSRNMPSKNEALNAVLTSMGNISSQWLSGFTEIFIFPGYQFKVVTGLLTNFHLPGTTLMMLVAAFTGENWKKIYQEALDNNYRFLSYGDSSFLLP